MTSMTALKHISRASGLGSISCIRTYSASATAHHRIVIVGGGTAGVTIAAQLKNLNHPLVKDIAILDPASSHHYQPGWTLVGTGLKPLSAMARPMSDLVPQGVRHYPLSVEGFDPARNRVLATDGTSVGYDFLVVAPGLETNFAGVAGLPDALADPASGVSSVYAAKSAEQTWANIKAFERGRAMFTQPKGVVKCAGAPQKVLWMALSEWKRNGVRDSVEPTFATGMPTMFAVPKYSQALEKLRRDRGVEGLFRHNLVEVDVRRRVARFEAEDDATDAAGQKPRLVEREYDFLHVVPPQKPWSWVAKSPLADAAGWVSVDKSTLQHTSYANVFSAGDASSLPNSKTAAAVTAQVPVLVRNLASVLEGRAPAAAYDGYASCPLLTGHGELMLAEFKYGGVPAETFGRWLAGEEGQAVPRRAFYHLKKDFFPWVYWNAFVKGRWAGPKGFAWRPSEGIGA